MSSEFEPHSDDNLEKEIASIQGEARFIVGLIEEDEMRMRKLLLSDEQQLGSEGEIAQSLYDSVSRAIEDLSKYESRHQIELDDGHHRDWTRYSRNEKRDAPTLPVTQLGWVDHDEVNGPATNDPEDKSQAYYPFATEAGRTVLGSLAKAKKLSEG